jgi:predicted nucleotidyltransferase
MEQWPGHKRTIQSASFGLFGSRANGVAKASSDVNIGLERMPANGRHDWALGNYAALGSRWRADLEAIVGCHVSLVPMIPGNEGDIVIRMTGDRLWQWRA